MTRAWTIEFNMSTFITKSDYLVKFCKSEISFDFDTFLDFSIVDLNNVLTTLQIYHGIQDTLTVELFEKLKSAILFQINSYEIHGIYRSNDGFVIGKFTKQATQTKTFVDQYNSVDRRAYAILSSSGLTYAGVTR